MSSSVTIALDAMGGDNAPQAILEGAASAVALYPALRFIVFGDTAQLTPLLEKHPALSAVCEVVHTDQVVASDEKPSNALKRATQSSMRLAINAVSDGRANGVISAGNTGALMAMSKIVLRMIPGIDRPAIAGLFPTQRGQSVMLDMGANVECDAKNLFQFALMGNAYARALGVESPKIGLLNVGSEEMKGNDSVRNAASLLKESALAPNFYGYVEGNDITVGTVDVVVTDGFTGNVALKTAEGLATMVSAMLKEAYASSWLTKIGYLLAKPALGAFRHKLNPKYPGGALLLGLNGVVFKSHGSADAETIHNAIHTTYEVITFGLKARIIDEVKAMSALMETRATTAK